MKAILERSINIPGDNVDYMIKLRELNLILWIITSSENETELRLKMKHRKIEFFEFGFGSNHMWVCESFRQSKPRVIFVEF